MLDSLPESEPEKKVSALYAFRMRHATLVPNQTAMGALLGFDQRWVSDREKGSKSEERWIPYALETLERKFKSKRESSDLPNCPECGAQMRLGKKYLKHWYYGKLKNRVV